MNAAHLSMLLAAAAACSHDWDRYDVVEDGQGGAAGAAAEAACLETCDAIGDCGGMAPASCAGDCAAAIAGCNAEDTDKVVECAKSHRFVCNESLYRNCLPACY